MIKMKFLLIRVMTVSYCQCKVRINAQALTGCKRGLTFTKENCICVTNWQRTINPSSRLICLPYSLSSDIDKSGYVNDFELQELFREASLFLPGYQVREIAERFISGDTNKDEKISFDEFVAVRTTDLVDHV